MDSTKMSARMIARNFFILLHSLFEFSLDCSESSIFIAAFSCDLKNVALLCAESENLENVVTIGNFVIAFKNCLR